MALKWLRDNLRHLKFILWGVVFVFVVLVFVDWGAGRSRGGASGDVAMSVGGRVVSEGEFIDQMRRNDQQFQRRLGDQWQEMRDSFDLAAYTRNELLGRELALADAKRAGLAVAPEEVREAILSLPAFTRDDGSFVGSDVYDKRVRTYFEMTREQFEQRFADDLLLEKLNRLIHDGVFVSDREVEEALRRERETADFDAIQLRYEQFLPEVEVADEELLDHYDRRAEDYRRDEQRVIRALVVEPSRLRRLLPAEDAQLESYYQENKDEFVEGEKARASHVLVAVGKGATSEERTDARLHADGVAAIARSGGDFAELARKHSDDPGSKDNGGDLGWFGRGRMVPEFEQAVWGAKPGDIVGPIESQFGFHIIKVEGFQAEHQRPFEEVKESVRFRYLEGQAAAEAERRATELARRLAAERPDTDAAWQSIADEDEAVVLNVSPPFSAGEAVQGMANSSDLAAEAFAAEVGEITGPRAIPRGWMVWQLSEIRPEGVPPFEDVRPQVEQEVRRQKAIEAAIARATEIATRWREGEDPATLAEEVSATVTEVRDHRRGAAEEPIGSAPSLDGAVFAAEEGAVVDPVVVGDRSVVVVRVVRLVLVDAAQVERERETFRSRLKSQRADRLLQAILGERQRETEVSINNELMERFAPRS